MRNKIIFLIVLILAFLFLVANKKKLYQWHEMMYKCTIEYYNNNEIRRTKCREKEKFEIVEFHPSGEIKSMYNLDFQNRIQGNLFEFYDAAQIKKKKTAFYNNGKKDSLELTYLESGLVKSQRNYNMDSLISEVFIYYDSSGEIDSINRIEYNRNLIENLE